MLKFGFFNSVKLPDGSYDRLYNAEDVNNYFKGIFSQNGIFEFVGNQCRVMPLNEMSVIVKPGKGQINYHWFVINESEIVNIHAAHPTLNRYTAVVIRFDKTNRNIYITTIDGDYDEIPTKPEIKRIDVMTDICVAYIYVKAGATEIKASDIIDTVEDTKLCGFVKSLITSTESGDHIVDILPYPNISEIGKIYYLRVPMDDKVPDYYICRKREDSYGYDTIEYAEGLLVDIPDPQNIYEGKAYHSTDDDNWCICRRNETGMYKWININVTKSSTLPTASKSTVDNYYYVNNVLSEGVIVYNGCFWDLLISIKNYLNKTTIVTIPSSGWTTNTDSSGKTYYTIDINVEGMYQDFVGTEDMQPVRPEPFNVDAWDKIKEEWAKISGVDSNDGYITVYANELLHQPIDVYIFGL